MKSQSLQLHILWHCIFCDTQALMQAPLYTAIFPQRFSVFTVYLVQWFCGLAPWWKPKRSLFEFKSVDRRKRLFRILLRIVKKSWLERLTTLLYASNQRVRKIGEENGKFFKGYSKTKKKKKT